MKKVNALTVLLASGVFSVTANAETRYEYAQVVEANPIYQVVELSEPSQQCWQEEVSVERSSRGGSNTPVVLSTIIGGAIGNAVGSSKSNQRVGAVLGAVLGHSIGRDIVASNRRNRVDSEIVERCKTVYETVQEERLMGYQVIYLFEGEERTVRTESDPGEQIKLRVSVQPVL
ncbi:MAG: hypothetical protein ACI95C_002111 [Pseudohongiellaceae bacterium]|jgi:uncharacterized protein YcfJ